MEIGLFGDHLVAYFGTIMMMDFLEMSPFVGFFVSYFGRLCKIRDVEGQILKEILVNSGLFVGFERVIFEKIG